MKARAGEAFFAKPGLAEHWKMIIRTCVLNLWIKPSFSVDKTVDKTVYNLLIGTGELDRHAETRFLC